MQHPLQTGRKETRLPVAWLTSIIRGWTRTAHQDNCYALRLYRIIAFRRKSEGRGLPAAEAALDDQRGGQHVFFGEWSSDDLTADGQPFARTPCGDASHGQAEKVEC